MREHYKKTFVGMQLVICLVTGGVGIGTHTWSLAALFFVTMQISAVIGAMWAARLKSKILLHASTVPVRRG